MAKHLDEQVAAFRHRPLDAGPYPVLWIDALTQKVRENGRVLTVHALVAVRPKFSSPARKSPALP